MEPTVYAMLVLYYFGEREYNINKYVFPQPYYLVIMSEPYKCMVLDIDIIYTVNTEYS